jgi:hypothetical protein
VTGVQKRADLEISCGDAKKCPFAAEETLRNQLRDLEETIGRLVRLAKSRPEGKLRDRLFEEISSLDSIADVMRQALDSLI